MFRYSSDDLYEAGCSGLYALALLAVVLLVPHPGWADGQSFFAVALHASWSRPLDMAAAWCAFKIILLSGALICACNCVSKLFEAIQQDSMAVAAVYVGMVPFMGLFAGSYFLLKALF